MKSHDRVPLPGVDGGTGSQKRSNGANGGNGKQKVLKNISFPFSSLSRCSVLDIRYLRNLPKLLKREADVPLDIPRGLIRRRRAEPGLVRSHAVGQDVAARVVRQVERRHGV